MGFIERRRLRALSGSEFVGITRIKFEGHRVAFVDEWSQQDPDEMRWWQIFGACAHAMHVANNLGRRHPGGQAIRAAFTGFDPTFVDLASDFEVVDALPHAPDEMAMEVWAGVEMPIVQGTLAGKRAKLGQYAVPASGLLFVRLLQDIDARVLGRAVRFHGEHIETSGWEPGDRQLTLTVAVHAMAQLAAEREVPDLYRFAADFGYEMDEEAGDGSEKTPLLEASDRLDEHILDGPFDAYFKLILLACSSAGYFLLIDYANGLIDRDDVDSTRVVGAFNEPAASDRAVRVATWTLLASAIAKEELLGADRWSELVDLASSAIPLDPAGLAAVARQIELGDAWLAESDDDDGDEPNPVFMSLTSHAHAWLLASTLQEEMGTEEDDSLEADVFRWSYCDSISERVRRLDELIAQNPDLVPE